MTYAMMKKTTKLMPLMRHKRSQNTGVVYALVDEDVAVVDAHEDLLCRNGESDACRRRVIGAAVGSANEPHYDRTTRVNPLDDGIYHGSRQNIFECALHASYEGIEQYHCPIDPVPCVWPNCHTFIQLQTLEVPHDS